MSSINKVLSRYMRQSFVYWSKTGSDQFGKPALADPLQGMCHWEDRLQEILTRDNRKVISRDFLITTIALTDGSIIFLGTLNDLDEPTPPPTVNQGGHEVLRVETLPDLKFGTVVYQVYA